MSPRAAPLVALLSAGCYQSHTVVGVAAGDAGAVDAALPDAAPDGAPPGFRRVDDCLVADPLPPMQPSVFETVELAWEGGLPADVELASAVDVYLGDDGCGPFLLARAQDRKSFATLRRWDFRLATPAVEGERAVLVTGSRDGPGEIIVRSASWDQDVQMVLEVITDQNDGGHCEQTVRYGFRFDSAHVTAHVWADGSTHDCHG